MQESYSRMQSKVQAKNSEIELLINKISSLEAKYFLFYVESIRFLPTLVVFSAKFKKASNKLESYRIRLSNIKIMLAESIFLVQKLID